MASFGRGPTKSKAAKKMEIAEKVQEIQMRQKNWMQQREQEIKNRVSSGGLKSSSVTELSSNNHMKKTTKSAVKESPFSQPRYQPSASQPAKGRFKSWLSAQEKHSNDSDHDLDTSPDVNVLRVDSSRSPGFASPDSDFGDYHRDEKAQEREREQSIYNDGDVIARLMSHKDFDSMADNIVSHVKHDLNMKDMGYEGSEQMNDRKWKSKSNDRSHEEMRWKKGEKSDLSSHYCPLCQKLMLSPVHSPVILIPCGHSVCQPCGEYQRRCPSCHSEVTSNTCNVMLKKIIHDYHSQREDSRRPRENTHNSAYSADNYNEKTNRFKDNRNKVKYREELENLQTRQEVLKSEVKSLQVNIKSLTNQIGQEEKQIGSVKKEEEKVKEQIRSMEEKLKMLQTHKNQYEKDKKELQRQKEDERNKLNLVQDTLLTVEIEMEKVRMLAQH